jgi:hypothetical protein
MNSHPTPGCLFAMGRSRSLSKDFIRFFKSAKKKNILLASILFYFLCHPSSIVSNTITSHPPCALHRSRVLSCTSPVAPACFRLVVGCICVVYWPYKVATYFFLLFFVDQFDGRTDATAHPTRSTPVASLLSRPLRTAFIDCNLIVVSPN